MSLSVKYKLSDDEDFVKSKSSRGGSWSILIFTLFSILLPSLLMNMKNSFIRPREPVFIYNISSIDSNYHLLKGLAPPIAPNLRVQSMYTLSSIFYHKLQNYHCVTSNPKEASLFFIPFHFSITLKCPAEVIEEVLKFPWLKRRFGKDHFVISNRPA